MLDAAGGARRGGARGSAAGCLGAAPSGPLRETLLELHHPHPPTASTGTTYNIEMYQCIRQARTVMVGHKRYHSRRPPASVREQRAP